MLGQISLIKAEIISYTQQLGKLWVNYIDKNCSVHIDFKFKRKGQNSYKQ